MKLKLLISTLAAAFASTAFAGTHPALYCSNGEETSVRLVQVAADTYRADVTVQSFGDSYPTYHFRNVRLQPNDKVGTQFIYKTRGFEMSVHYVARGEARLNVPSLGIRDEALTCKPGSHARLAAPAAGTSLEARVCVILQQGSCAGTRPNLDWGSEYSGREIWLAISYNFGLPASSEAKFSKVIDSPVCRNSAGWTNTCVAAATRAAMN